jgi:prepilin signal peptidase PulO-like enzyme (type II secretory pathway)
MAPKKNDFGGLITISQAFFSQLVFWLFLTLIFIMTGAPPSLSIFLGILGSIALSGLTTATRSGPQTPTIGSADGIDAGLKYWLFFLLGFLFLGYPAPMSVLLSALAGLGGGWIIAWWETREETKTQLATEGSEDVQEELPNERAIKRKRRPTRRYRRSREGFNFRFWER